MAFNTDIANLALSHLGSGKEIGVLETERSAEAQACRRYFELAREVTLRDAPWAFGKRIAVLALETLNPNTRWKFSYRYPVDAANIRGLLSEAHPCCPNPIPFEVFSDAAGKLIYTNLEDAEVEFTYNVTDAARFPSDFKMALSFRLAAYIAPRLTGGDSFNLGAKALQMYMMEIKKAKATDYNETQKPTEATSEFQRARE